MAVQLILSTDTLETGFRLKANNSFGAIIVAAAPQIVSGNFTGIIRLTCFDGSFINLDLTSAYYTQTQITQIISALLDSPYSGLWNSAFSGGYPVLSIVDHNGNIWRSNNSGNSDEPGTSGTWAGILNVNPPDEDFFYAAGSALSAAVIDMTTGSRPLFGLRPQILREINKNIDGVVDDTILTPADDITYYKQYTDNTYTVLASISINGHDDGSGNFLENTYITIKK